MHIAITERPEAEPLSVQQAKDWVRADNDEENTLLAALIRAAREEVERLSGYALGEQSLQLWLDAFPCAKVLPLPRPPLLTVDEITYVDRSGNVQTLAADAYEVDKDAMPGSVRVLTEWPRTLSMQGAVRIKYTCGYTVVPERLLLATRYLVEKWYGDRAEGVIPSAVLSLIEPRLRYRLPL